MSLGAPVGGEWCDFEHERGRLGPGDVVVGQAQRCRSAWGGEVADPSADGGMRSDLADCELEVVRRDARPIGANLQAELPGREEDRPVQAVVHFDVDAQGVGPGVVRRDRGVVCCCCSVATVACLRGPGGTWGERCRHDGEESGAICRAGAGRSERTHADR